MRKHSTGAQLTSIIELAKYLKTIDLEKEFDFKVEKELDLDEFGVKVEELFNFKKNNKYLIILLSLAIKISLLRPLKRC